jgi:uncharacterized RmlC-like cupin family protein
MVENKVTGKQQKKVHVASTHKAKLVHGPQSQRLIVGAAEELCGCEAISAGVVWMPPSKVAKPHLHQHNELINFLIEGWAATAFGENLDELVYHGPGDFLFIPEGVIHLGINLSDKHRVVALETRTDPKFNEDVVVFPELEDKANTIAERLRKEFAAGTLLPEAKEIGFGPFNFKEPEAV